MPIGMSRLRITRFLRSGRDGIESDVSEEHDTGRAENSKNTAVMMRDALRRDVRCRRRNKRRVVRRINELPADADEEQDDRHFQNYDDSVHERRFFRATNEQHRQDEQNEKRRHVHDAVRAAGIVFEWRMRPLIGDRHVEPAEHAVRVFAPRVGHGRRGDGVFENQIPTDDPCDEFAHGRVRIRVGAAGDGNHRRELGVAQTGERAADAGHDKRQHNRRTRAIGDGSGGPHEQTGTDDSANAEREQVHPA